MEPHERRQLIARLLEDATHREAVLEEAAAAKQKEIAHIEASQHITDDEPNAQPVYTVQEELASWETIVRALAEIQTTLNQLEESARQRGIHMRRAGA
jgi:hypothetical protein